MNVFRVKICGITQPQQGRAIAWAGATALGFICTSRSPRYVTPAQIQAIVAQLPRRASGEIGVDRIGVFVQASLDQIKETVAIGQLTGVQLHGDESPAFCQQVRQALPETEVIKALRIRSGTDLAAIAPYLPWIDTLLLDAYHPQQFGGTGQTLDWATLEAWSPPCPWLLAGGLTPLNVQAALQRLTPDGLDLSSGVERSPGDKDLVKVQQLFSALSGLAPAGMGPPHSSS